MLAKALVIEVLFFCVAARDRSLNLTDVRFDVRRVLLQAGRGQRYLLQWKRRGSLLPVFAMFLCGRLLLSDCVHAVLGGHLLDYDGRCNAKRLPKVLSRHLQSLKGQTSCQFCLPGQCNADPGKSSCLPCRCVSCLAASFCPSPGMSRFTPCVAGSYCPDARMSIPTVCPLGSYCPTNSTFAHPCPPGWFCPNGNMTEALPCPSGSYCPSRPADRRQAPCATRDFVARSDPIQVVAAEF